MLNLDGLFLPSGLVWVDEFSWTPTQQKAQYSISGALIVDSASKQAGRSITLQGSEDSGWVTRATILALYATLDSKARYLTMDDGQKFLVVWNHSGNPIQATPLLNKSVQEDEDYYSNVRLSFLTV